MPLITARRFCELLLPSVERAWGYSQTLANLRYRIAPFSDLRHCVPFEIVAEITSGHDGLLDSKLGKTASTNLGAIQSTPNV